MPVHRPGDALHRSQSGHRTESEHFTVRFRVGGAGLGVCLSRRANGGRHTVVPLQAAIQERCRAIGFDNLAPIIWHKIANARHEAAGQGAGCLGKPYEPNAVLKNDLEFVLMQRKPGGYRTPSPAQRALSVIPATDPRRWFQQVWTGLPGTSTPGHPAHYPLALA